MPSKGVWAVTACLLAGETGLLLSSCGPKEAAKPGTRSAAEVAAPAPSPRERDAKDAGVAAATASSDANRSSVDSIFSEVCRAFEPKGRVPASPSPHCSGPARDLLTGARDSAARKKLDEVLTTNYLARAYQLESDLAVLVGISNACETRCTAPTQAKIWMYIGVLYGSGFNDLENARCAFEVSLAWNPRVALDEELCTPRTKEAFAGARASRCGAG